MSDRDRRHRWAETCENLAEWLPHSAWQDAVTDLREIAVYLRDCDLRDCDCGHPHAQEEPHD